MMPPNPTTTERPAPDLSGLDDVERGHVTEALALAERLHSAAAAARTPKELALDAERSRMVKDAHGKETVTALLDRAFRSPSPTVTARQISVLLHRRGVPGFFAPIERAGLALAFRVGTVAPWLVVPAIKAVMRRKTAEVILPGQRAKLTGHVRARRAAGVRLNLNHLGEMILGEREADEKLDDDVALLAHPDVDCISVKASNLFSQITAIAHDRGVAMLAERLRPRLRAAKTHRRSSYDAAKAPAWDKGCKLVNLDMEEYRDLPITVDAFIRVLDEAEFLDLQVGIAMQAYVPDTYVTVERLLAWAKGRVGRGGAPIRIRVVKGANRSMELVDSSVRGIEVPTYDDKTDTDANWKSIIELITRPEHITACHLGVASHNIFDIAWASILIARRGVADHCVYEMLEGMANHVQRHVRRELGDVLLYAPAVAPGKFLTAIAYLVRRFDELTDPNNFLSHVFGIEPGSDAWNAQARNFIESVRRMRTVSHARRRTQDRTTETPAAVPVPRTEDFRNEPDTDWTAERNREWLANAVIAKRAALASSPETLRLPIPGTATPRVADIRDRSYPDTVVARAELASREDAERVLAAAAAAAPSWTDLAPHVRDGILSKATAEFQRRRADLMAFAAANVGKTFDQSDSEISEAVDFGRLYPLSARHFRESLPHLRVGPLGGGVVMVISPWNFPIAIPAGGTFAALAAGNRVILKPSAESRLITAKIAECFWAAGVPKDALQVLICPNDIAGALVADPRVDGVVFTGSTTVADKILASRPGIALFAETGGKNATIITGNADRELAVKHVADSFRNNGQKCSATSLVLATPDVYGDHAFWDQLTDAVRSLPVGPAWDPASVITPLFRAPGEELRRGLTTLEPGEEWVLKPERVDGREDFWTPGIKKGSRRGGFTHVTELFGPVITVMRVTDVDDALAAVHETGRGLTLGIESLDDDEVRRVTERAKVGVMYVRRSTVGAIANRQTFGGFADSRRGPGMHAGSINYVTDVMTFEEVSAPASRTVSAAELAAAGTPADAATLLALAGIVAGDAAAGIRSAAEQWVDFFAREHRPPQDVRGEDNIHRYRPVGRVAIRVTDADSTDSVLIRLAAARFAGNDVEASAAFGSPVVEALTRRCPKLFSMRDIHWYVETADEFAARVARGGIDVVRYANPNAAEPPVLAAAASHPRTYVSRAAVLMTGRIELLRYVQEQTVSDTYHRYGGNLREKDL